MPRTIAINRMPIVGWVFALAWLGMLLLFTMLHVRSGGSGQMDPAIERLILGAFWIVGLGIGAHLLHKPVVVLESRGARLRVVHRRLWGRRIAWEDDAATAPAVSVAHVKDSEGDPYFQVELAAPSLPPFVIFEGHDLPSAEAARDRINAAIDNARRT